MGAKESRPRGSPGRFPGDGAKSAFTTVSNHFNGCKTFTITDEGKTTQDPSGPCRWVRAMATNQRPGSCPSTCKVSLWGSMRFGPEGRRGHGPHLH